VASEFKLPDLGEGVEAGDVVRVLVSEGDLIEADQAVLELETDKALIEVPCPFAGTVASVDVKEGDKVPVGAVLITVEETEAEAKKSAEPQSKVEDKVEKTEPEDVKAGDESADEAPQPARQPAVPEPAPQAPPQPDGKTPAPAAPVTRRFARELGVDLHQVPGSGPGGRIVREDVQAHVRQAMAGKVPAATVATVGPPLPDFAKWGEIERQPLRSVRRKTAERMGLAWSLAPHVTQFDRADVTDLEAFRQRHKAEADARAGRLTPTVLILKAVVTALKAFPQFNASLDLGAGELVLKRYYHIGIAVDSDRGLLVPVIRDVDRKDILELAVELNDMAERTRQGKVTLEELQGGAFTLTNLGSIGGTAFTPIVNYPEVAILGIARSREEPVVRNGRVESRLMMPLCLSYDHRVIDGAAGARFTQKLVESLENPEKMLLGG